ncbi:MAG: hypothetical protein ACJ8BW_23825 [Ktedonobacteraceae bacterium]
MAKEVDDPITSEELEQVAKETEEARRKRRYELQRSITDSGNTVRSLLRRLIINGDESRRLVICDMLEDEYRNAAYAINEFKEVGGEYYSVDQGLWREYFDRDY